MSSTTLFGEKNEKSPDFTSVFSHLPVFFHRGDFTPERRLSTVSSGITQLLGINVPAPSESPLELNSFIRETDRQPAWQSICTSLESNNGYQVEYRLRHTRGHWLTVWEQGQGIRNEQNQVIGLEGIILDITERAVQERARRLQEFETLQANKSKSINLLASGVAHDFNNVVAGILGSAELVKMELDSQASHACQEFLQQIFVAGDRARELIHQIKALSQRPSAERRLVQLPSIITESAQLVRSIIPEKLEIIDEVGTEFPAVLADASQLQQVIINLCTHAWHNMPDGKGRVELKLSLRELDAERMARHPELRAGTYLCLTIADNGPGMSKSAQDRIFEPFAHRRPNGKKSGLELFLVQEIMTAHQGVIFLDSKPGEGTTFQLCFPLAN